MCTLERSEGSPELWFSAQAQERGEGHSVRGSHDGLTETFWNDGVAHVRRCVADGIPTT